MDCIELDIEYIEFPSPTDAEIDAAIEAEIAAHEASCCAHVQARRRHLSIEQGEIWS